ncbi:predicted protein [Chaetoceros tenuissimus]|uniref:Uncharacterized protein n=1 Tax=Chaetoceros tenuissimus TaxID=426638 RepID=A0AAD3DCL4_9STRA|nr:predicted protein [Chaetoceros tenuissimus]
MEWLMKDCKADGKYFSEKAAMDAARDIVRFTALAPVHPSKWRVYRGLQKVKKDKRDEENSDHQDYVMIGRNDVEN